MKLCKILATFSIKRGSIDWLPVTSEGCGGGSDVVLDIQIAQMSPG